MLAFRSQWFLFVGISLVSSLYSCYDGFVGRIWYWNEREFHYVNETRMCAAKSCIQVTLHNASDRDGNYHEGISTRCAYTGGDRHLCQTSNCTLLQHYNGMHGKFTFCCCEGNGCNLVSESSLVKLYSGKDAQNKTSTNGAAARSTTIFFAVFTLCLLQ